MGPIDNKAMLDIFDDLSQKHSLDEKDNFSILEEKAGESSALEGENYLMPGEEQTGGRMGQNGYGNASQVLLSRKGSGDQAQILDTSISFMYRTDPVEAAPEGASPMDFGAVLTPNVEYGNIFERRATDNDHIIKGTNVQGGLLSMGSCSSPDAKTRDQTLNRTHRHSKRMSSRNLGGSKVLVTEENYTEKFDYKKFINQELSKLGNICG